MKCLLLPTGVGKQQFSLQTFTAARYSSISLTATKTVITCLELPSNGVIVTLFKDSSIPRLRWYFRSSGAEWTPDSHNYLVSYYY